MVLEAYRGGEGFDKKRPSVFHAHMVDEKRFRERLNAFYERVETAFDSIDPDLAECNQSHGALTIQFADGTKCILSAQPSVRQLWMAVADRGEAFHFDFDEATSQWRDDKGRGIVASEYLIRLVREKTHEVIQI